jgi:hypothetical protein
MIKTNIIKNRNVLIQTEWNRILGSPRQSLRDLQGERAGGYKNMPMKM